MVRSLHEGPGCGHGGQRCSLPIGNESRLRDGQTLIVDPDILTLFRKGDIDGAWVPEPWATRLIKEAGGRVFLDERDLWPNGDFVTTHLIVRTQFLEERPDVVKRRLGANVAVTQWINDNPEEARKLVNEGIRQATGAALPQDVVDAAWENLRITYDPIASSLQKSAADAFELGFLGDEEPDLSGIYALDLLNEVLEERGLPAVGASTKSKPPRFSDVELHLE